MKKGYSCFVISPIGAAGSEINRQANFVYEMIISPVLGKYGISYMRGDQNANSNHIGMDVIQCIREADLCIVDISSPNCNVYYELGLADAMNIPVILMKENAVDASQLPADVSSRKYTTYSSDMKNLRESWNNLDAFVRGYLSELESKGTQEDTKRIHAEDAQTQIKELMEVIRRLEEREQSAGASSQLKLPMDLRPGKPRTQMEDALEWELNQQLDDATQGLGKKDAAQHERIDHILDRIRSTLGESAYLQQLMRRSGDSAYIWEKYLACAMLWLDVEIAHCVLDISWLRGLCAGIGMGFGTPEQHQQTLSICNRVLAISRTHGEVKMVDQTGVYRHYDPEMAYYYRGLCQYNMFRQSKDVRCLRNASDDWWHLKGRRVVETHITLAKEYQKASRLAPAKSCIERALEKEPSFQFPAFMKRDLLETAYGIYRDLNIDAANPIYEQMMQLSPETAADMRRRADIRCEERKKLEAFKAELSGMPLPRLIQYALEAVPLHSAFIEYYVKLYPDAPAIQTPPSGLKIELPHLIALSDEIKNRRKNMDKPSVETIMLDNLCATLEKGIEFYRDQDKTAAKSVSLF